MNFLAHIYLSGNDPEILVGNFIGDFVKGRNLAERFDHTVVRGINLHRAIDEYTDRHPVVTESKTRLREKYRHYAPVIVDVFYDHFLAKIWTQYHDMPLIRFADVTYHTIQQYDTILPESVRHMLPYMIRGNWLVHYAEVEGIQRALTGMSRRTKFNSRMDESVNDLIRDYDHYEEEFTRFFPDLISHTQKILLSQH